MNTQNESLFKALGDAQRRRLLRLLRQGEATSGSLAECLDIAPATVSHHLALLRAAGLVRVRREGRLRWYALNATMVEEALLMLTELLSPAEEEKS